MQVAENILEQLGGNKFIAMTGAKNLVASSTDDFLMFNIMKNVYLINKVKITLNSMDTYDLEFFKIRNMKATKIKSFSGVYNDDLRSTFENATGLATSL
jgi:hypothetical protein